MRASWPFLASVAVVPLAGCTGEAGGESDGSVDVAAAAEQAEDDIRNYAARQPSGRAPAVRRSAPVPLPPTDVTADPPSAREVSRSGGRDVVRRYYALVAQGRDAAARQLWERGAGRSGADDSGLGEQAIRQALAPYATFRADVGEPVDGDAGMSQRYLSVPVVIRAARRADGREETLQATMLLHRTIAGVGAPPEKQRWRIRDVQVAAVDGAGDAPQRVTARYRCGNGSTLRVVFDNAHGIALLDEGKARPLRLVQQRAASGIWYIGDGAELRGKGDEAQLMRQGVPPVSCQAEMRQPWRDAAR